MYNTSDSQAFLAENLMLNLGSNNPLLWLFCNSPLSYGGCHHTLRAACDPAESTYMLASQQPEGHVDSRHRAHEGMTLQRVKSEQSLEAGWVLS